MSAIYNPNLLSDEELIGQLLCPDFSGDDDFEIIKERIRNDRLGSFFICNATKERIKAITDYANSISKYPVLVMSDMENGVGSNFPGEASLPSKMSWGAADDEVLAEKAGEATGIIARDRGIHVSFSPVVDININPRNPLVNTRSVSDSAKQVAKISCACIKGMQKNNNLAATAKHFPGDGVDDRNQHFCTTVNSLSAEEWDETYGYVYKKVIDAGVKAIMVAHIALPAYDSVNIDPVTGPMPATLSYPLITKLLKNKLGFKGCVVSDAMSMIGSASLVPSSELAMRFIKAGGDIVLFNDVTDHADLLKALHDGSLPRERVLDAVNRVLELKKSVGLFDEKQNPLNIEKARKDIIEVSEKISEKSIKIVRNPDGVLPLSLKKGDKALIINLYLDIKNALNDPNIRLEKFAEELEKRGIKTDVYHSISHYEIHKIIHDYDAVFVNCAIDSQACRGRDMNVGWWDGIMTFWRAYILQNKNIVFTSFGDPYKIYEFPYMRTYVNAFSRCPETQAAAIAVLLGEKPCIAKSPVSLKGFFERETD